MDNDLDRTQRLIIEDLPMKNIPLVCSWCKRIYRIERWKFEENQKTGVSHGICPECMKKLQTQITCERKGDTPDAQKERLQAELRERQEKEARPPWEWEESIQRGTDYRSVEEVRAYDKRMSEFRDIAAENLAALKALNAKPGFRILDIGAGTGSFSIAAAQSGCKVLAVDVSEIMLEYAAAKAFKAEVEKHIEFKQTGFIGLDEQPSSFDGIETGLALHHLPDLWKAVALDKLFSLLKPGRRLHIRDVVFTRTGEGWSNYFDRLVISLDGSSSNFAKHIRQEYSTLDWIMRGLLEQAGFKIIEDATRPEAEYLHSIIAEKPVAE